MDITGRLQSHPLFATFGPKELAEVVRVSTLVTYQPNDICIQQGEAGEIFGVLLSGRLEAVRSDPESGRRHLGYIEPGECFGEMSLLTGSSTHTEVLAVEESQAVVFMQEAIAPLIAVNREAVQFLTKLITSRLAPSPEKPKVPLSSVARYSLGASSPMRLLSLSCRRDDVRYSYFETSSETAIAWGRITGLGSAEAVHVFHGPADDLEGRVTPATHEAAVTAAFDVLSSTERGIIASATELSAVGHRVCHGGFHYNGPAIVNDEVKETISRFASLAPLDNEYNLKGIEACERLAPGVPQVAVFDTSFHLKMPPASYLYALPNELAMDPELRRAGFHGISHEGAWRAASAHLGKSAEVLKMVSCHLGDGASISAIDHGRAVDNSMGFTSLEGLVMATRSGDVDPGLVLYLVKERKIPPEELMRRLFTESGLLGLSGISGDVLTVARSAEDGNPQALLALQVYCLKARKYLSAYIGLLGGVDAIVFTGGVGENSPGVRARICQGLDWMGIVLDETENRLAHVTKGQVVDISQPQSRARVLVVGGDEEATIARKTVGALSRKRVTDIMRKKQREIPIGISAHHVHLSAEHVEALFGPGHTLTWHADLTQSGQFACKEQVSLIGPKGRIDNVRVLGPVRRETQVEISRTEEFKLGIDAPIRLSGDLDGTPGLTLEGPNGTVALERGVICAMRHIHMAPQDAMEFAVRNHDVVRVRVTGERSLIFGDVVIRVDPDFRLAMHIDTDEANAAELGPDATGLLDSIQERVSA